MKHSGWASSESFCLTQTNASDSSVYEGQMKLKTQACGETYTGVEADGRGLSRVSSVFKQHAIR